MVRAFGVPHRLFVPWGLPSRVRILGGECPCIALTMGARPPTPGKQLNGVRALGVKERWGLDSEVSHGASCRGTHPVILHHSHTSGGPDALHGPGGVQNEDDAIANKDKDQVFKRHLDTDWAIYVDTAYVNRGTGHIKPQYLLAVDPK